MGIDVYGLFQIQKNGKWHSIREYSHGRRGYLRSWLGWGPRIEPSWGERIKPISPIRGLPEDFDSSEIICQIAYDEMVDFIGEPVLVPPHGSDLSKRCCVAENLIGDREHTYVFGEEILIKVPLLVRQIDITWEVYAKICGYQLDNIDNWKAFSEGYSMDVPSGVGFNNLIDFSYQEKPDGVSVEFTFDLFMGLRNIIDFMLKNMVVIGFREK